MQWPIISRKKDQLFEGDKVFRFFGLAAPNIQQNESQLLPDMSNRFPDEYEIRDCYEGLRRTGSRATRTFSLSIAHPNDKGMPVYVEGKRKYNETAFRCLDQVIAYAKEYDVRLIIPFIASQSFGGIRGADEFAVLSGKTGPQFWSDPEVKADFKHFLSFILNRKNTVNGIVYKNDPAILCWQLGNEFTSYPYDRSMDVNPWWPVIQAWSSEMAAFIKQEDPQHLISEANGCDREAMIADPNIDIISEHYYEYWNKIKGAPYDLSKLALEVWEQCKGKKVFMVDEFGLGSVENQLSLMKTIRSTGIAGGLLWAIRNHRRDGGWYYHNEGGTSVNSFHVPGFAAGLAYDETLMLDLITQEAWAIRGETAPAIEKPFGTPILFKRLAGLTWRGCAGASSYSIERAAQATGPWTCVVEGVQDSIVADVKTFEPTPEASFPLVLWQDVNVKPGSRWFYRIQGRNLAGSTPWSEALGVQY